LIDISVNGTNISQIILNGPEIKYGVRKPQRPNLAKAIIVKTLDT
jgi:hypothetical protein